MIFLWGFESIKDIFGRMSLICLIIPILFWIGYIVNDRRYRVLIKNTIAFYNTSEALHIMELRLKSYKEVKNLR